MDWRLIKRSFTSSLDEVDRRVLEAWLGESERHRQLYEEMKRFVAKRENFQLSVEAKKQFKREFDSRIDEAYRRRGRRVWLKVVSYAAMLALPIIAGILLWTRQPVEEVVDYGIGPIKHGARKATLVLNDGKVLALDTSRMTLKESDGVTIHTNDQALVYVDSLDNKGENLQNRLITPKGGEYTIMLADGTKVWVNAATEIRYPVKFAAGERRVYLDGEAFFEVEKAKGWPFIVETDRMHVRVTGTKFNVKSYRSEEVVHTTLVQGTVKVNTTEDWAEAEELVPLQQYYLDKRSGQAQVKQVDTGLFTDWIEGRFVFKDQRLEEVMGTLARWYSVEVFYATPSVKNWRLSANLGRYEHIDAILKMIQATDKVEIVRKKNTITIGWK